MAESLFSATFLFRNQPVCRSNIGKQRRCRKIRFFFADLPCKRINIYVTKRRYDNKHSTENCGQAASQTLRLYSEVLLWGVSAADSGSGRRLHVAEQLEMVAFHESWTAEERAALSRFDSYLTNGEFERDFLMGMNTVSENLDSLQARLGLERASAAERFRIRLEQQVITLYMSHLLGKPMRRELAAIVSSGSAKREPLTIQASVKDTPARFALYTGNTEAAKAMIRHGADVNFRGAGTKESLLSCLLSDRSLKGTHPMPLQER